MDRMSDWEGSVLCFGMSEKEQNIKIRMKIFEEKEKYLSQDTFTPLDPFLLRQLLPQDLV